jgi:hypothetical protein
MKTPKHKVEFTTGRMVLNSPCHVGNEAFTPTAAGNRFCSTCKKVVYDMSKLSEIETKALFQANEGKVCGSFPVQIPRPEPQYSPASQVRKALYIKQLAAAASIFLLYQTAQSKPISKPSIAWQTLANITGDDSLRGNLDPRQTNTLVTGVILNQDSELVSIEIPVLIYSGKTLVAQVKTTNGMFRVDLGDKLHPDAVLEIVVRERKSTTKSVYAEAYGPGKAITRLGDAQNVVVQVEYHFPRMLMGDIGWEEIESTDESLENPANFTSKSNP